MIEGLCLDIKSEFKPVDIILVKTATHFPGMASLYARHGTYLLGVAPKF